MQPTYRPMPDYSGLISKATGQIALSVKGGLEKTVHVIHDTALASRPQVMALARHLKADTLMQSAYNVYHFITSNVRYQLDEPGYEQIRTAARSWRDRATGVDCEDYAILASALFADMGYQPFFEVVAFGGRADYQHIFCVVYEKGTPLGIVVDPTPNPGQGPVPFNERPAGISKTMKIEVLSGVGAMPEARLIAGLAGLAPATTATDHFEQIRNDAIAGRSLGSVGLGAAQRAIRIAEHGIAMNGLPEQETYAAVIAPFLYDVDPIDGLVPLPGADLGLLDQMDHAHSRWQSIDYRPGKMSDLYPHTEGTSFGEIPIGNWFTKTFDKAKKAVTTVKNKALNTVKRVAKTATNAVKQAVKATGEGIKNASKWVAEKGVRFLMKYNPLMVLARNGFLGLLKLNSFNIAGRLRFGFMGDAQAQREGINMDELRKMRDTTRHFQDFWVKLGGDRGAVKKAVLTGSAGRVDEPSVNGIGEPATTTTATVAASGIVAKVLSYLKEIDFKKLLNKPEAENVSDDEIAQANAMAEKNNFSSPEEREAYQNTMREGTAPSGDAARVVSPAAKSAESSPGTFSGANLLVPALFLAGTGVILYSMNQPRKRNGR